MTKTTRKNKTTKALQSFLSTQEKLSVFELDKNALRLERRLIGAVNNRGENLDCSQVMDICKNTLIVLGTGATKIAYGTDNLAICFIKSNYHKTFGNQIAMQVKAWERIALTDDAKYFNPVLSYGLHRGDKLNTNDERYINKSFIVSPKAKTFNTIEENIRKMYELNSQNYTSDMVKNYKDTLYNVAFKYDIGDIHGGNIGVIYDYNTNTYRAVIIDYGIIIY